MPQQTVPRSEVFLFLQSVCEKRVLAYMGARGEMYTESYPEVDVPGLVF